MNKKIVVTVEMDAEQAWCLAQMIKRISFTTCRTMARDEEEAYNMLYACDEVGKGLAEVGYAPR